MLAQELYADVHQLHRVKRAAAVVRVARRVRGLAGKLVEHLDAGVVRPGLDLVDVARMPAQRRVERLPQALAGHVGLAAASFLAGAAEEDHRAAPAALFQIALDGCRRGERARSEQIVSAAVSGPAGNERRELRLSRLLAQTGERVVLSQDADHRLAAAVGAAEGRVDPAEPFRHRKAERAQRFAVKRRRLMLLQGKLRVFPDPVRDALIQRRVFVDRRDGFFLLLVHDNTSCLRQRRKLSG